MSLDDLFGPNPLGRPDHPDMTILVDIALAQDGKTEDRDFDMDEFLGTIVDTRSVSYMAFQRALRMVGLLTGEDPQQHMVLVHRFSSMWIDAFMMGAEFQNRKRDEAPPPNDDGD